MMSLRGTRLPPKPVRIPLFQTELSNPHSQRTLPDDEHAGKSWISPA